MRIVKLSTRSVNSTKVPFLNRITFLAFKPLFFCNECNFKFLEAMHGLLVRFTINKNINVFKIPRTDCGYVLLAVFTALILEDHKVMLAREIGDPIRWHLTAWRCMFYDTNYLVGMSAQYCFVPLCPIV